MYVGEGAEQLEAHAREMERRAKGPWPPTASKEYYRGLTAGLMMAARAARKESLRLRRARRKAMSTMAALDAGDDE